METKDNSRLVKWLKLLGVLATVLSALTGLAISVHTISSTFKDPVAAKTTDKHKDYMVKTRDMVSKNRELLVQISIAVAQANRIPAPVTRIGVVPRTIRRRSRRAPAPAPPMKPRVILTPPSKLFKKLRELPKIEEEAPDSYDQVQKQMER